MSKLTDLAREAGRAGVCWTDFTFRDDVQTEIDATENISAAEDAISAAQAAWEEGNREHRIASGWVVCFTTAPADYDTFGTETLAIEGEWKGRELRKVLMHPHHADYQRDRYGSGLHASWPDDPRVEEARLAEQAARWKAEDEAKATKRANGLSWLLGLSDHELDTLDLENDAIVEDRGLTWRDVRDEDARRVNEKSAAGLKAEWDRCAALVPDGCTILDNGTKGYRGVFGWIPGHPTRIYYRCKLVPHWDKNKAGDPDEAVLEAECRLGDSASVFSLALAAERIAEGRYQIVAESDVPPRPVAERFGMENVKRIKKVEAEGRTVWVGQSQSWNPPEVLDEKGRIVRAKKVREAALRIASELTSTE